MEGMNTNPIPEKLKEIAHSKPFHKSDKDLFDLMYAAYQLAEGEKWVSVETPPAETEEILMSNIDDKWISKGYIERGSYYNSYDHDCECYPTHWMPLPPHPTPPVK